MSILTEWCQAMAGRTQQFFWKSEVTAPFGGYVLTQLRNLIKQGVVTSSFVLNVNVFPPWQIKLCATEKHIPDGQKKF